MPDVKVTIAGKPEDRCFFVLNGQELATVGGAVEVALSPATFHRLRYAFTGTSGTDYEVRLAAEAGAQLVRRDATGVEVEVAPIAGKIPEKRLFVGGNLKFKVKVLALFLGLVPLGRVLPAEEALAPATSETLAVLSSNPSFEDSLVVTPTGGASLEAGSEDGQARFRLSGRGGRGSWSLTLGSPVDGGDFTDLASLDGLAGGLNLAVAWSTLSAPHEFAAGGVEKDEALESICLGAGLGDSCDTAQLIAKGDVAAARAYEYTLFGDRPFRSWSLEAKLGRQRSEFFDAAAAARTETHVGWSVGGSFGLLFRSSFLYGSVRFESSYDDQAKVQKCSSTNLPAGLERCRQLPFGPPERVESPVATLGWRIFVRKIALDPKIHRDFETEVTGIELPIYFVNDGDTKLTGGIRFGWRSETADGEDPLSAAVFVAAPLEIGF